MARVKLSANFYRDEFACQCGCGYDTVDAELLTVLQDVRDHFGKAVTINSAARCAAHNKAVGGAPTSQHLYAKAADFTVERISPSHVQAYLQGKYPNRYGVGKGQTFTHIDVRPTRAEWGY